ncbi:SET [Glarea lozoyensis ATCC 20868]|uniref:SET n=1 Tax=Glarea lozoyensis (strain ATCC 20868 / MF5171) TaxID=1116229 RepID=S3DP67_GLAL2|nr:SET [Glarea lozoyensis ATCC 20868]EPE33886.1 SET [Glarea lozoyensis ATCC 20868]
MQAQFVEIRVTEEKGRAVFAIKKIPRGTKLFYEPPFFLLPAETEEQPWTDDFIKAEGDKQGMTAEKWAKFKGLYNCFHDEENIGATYHGRVLTNGNDIEKKVKDTPDIPFKVTAIYDSFSMISHSCAPNCTQSYVQETSEMRVYANKEIEIDKEITISYLGEDMFGEDRKQILKQRFKFDCTCRLCKVTGTALTEQIAKFAEIDSLVEHSRFNAREVILADRQAYLNKLKDLLFFLISGDLGGGTQRRVYRNATKIMAIQGTSCTPQMMEFGRLWYDYTRALFGEGNETAEVNELCRDWSEEKGHEVRASWPSSRLPLKDPLSETEEWLWKIK